MKNVARAIVVGGMAGVGALMVSGVALADSPAYPPAAPPVGVTQVLGETISDPAPTVATPSAALPFTGLDTIALVGVGAVLVGGGAALTVASRRRHASAAR
jgi:hypothetical protein